MFFSCSVGIREDRGRPPLRTVSIYCKSKPQNSSAFTNIQFEEVLWNSSHFGIEQKNENVVKRLFAPVVVIKAPGWSLVSAVIWGWYHITN